MSNYCLTPGVILGDKYQIIKLIGQGGMGTVYMAYDIRLDLQVAIKVISPAIAGAGEEPDLPDALKRFEAEAKIAAKIDHPNVVRIFGYHTDSIELDGKAREIEYLVMELLSGRTLRNTMDISGFESEKEISNWIITYLLPTLDGLEKVHECGIIHRDIKPENFLMKGNTPKIADFGLSMGFNFPAVTSSIADVFGTAPYVSPEQFYNFSMARETADIYSIGKILYEAVEGKMTDKVKPFKQVSLSHPDTDFLKQLDCIILNATAENVSERTPSVQELKKQLIGLISNEKQANQRQFRRPVADFLSRKVVLLASLVLFFAVGAWGMHFAHNNGLAWMDNNNHTAEEHAARQNVRMVPYKASAYEPVIVASDNSALLFIPPAELILGGEKTVVDPVYISENPVTNGQYADFLNKISDRVTIQGDDVYIDGRLAITLSEKIRGYIPISHDGEDFTITHPMHSSCGVLLVTGFGAEAYAEHFGMRLPTAREWIYIALTGNNSSDEILQLPVPVMDYEPDDNGLRGIGEIAEWSRTMDGSLVVMDPEMAGNTDSESPQTNDPESYYTDTGFRVAKSAGD